MRNNEIIEDKLKDIYNGLDKIFILENMINLGFDCVYQKEVHNKFSKPTQLYLFINTKVGLCEISTYEDKVSSTYLYVNLDFKDKIKGFSHNFTNASWASSTGTASGYGHSIKVGSLNVRSMNKTLNEINNKSIYVFPFIENNFLVSEKYFSQEELEKYPDCKDIMKSTQWFIDNKLEEKYQQYFKQADPIDTVPLSYWDDHIRLAYQDLEKIPKKDKGFYYICKKIFTDDIEDIKPLIDKNFIHTTSSLGHNICHLMSLIQNPEKKILLWNHFQTLPQKIQSEFINQNDLAGYNPILLLAQHSCIKTVTDQALNLDFFEKYLSIKTIEKSFFNEKNSLLDCLFYGTSDLVKRKAEYIQKINEANLEIPLIYLNKENGFSHKQKVTDIFKDEDIKYKLKDEVYNLIIKSNLNLRLRDTLSIKDNIIKTKKI